MNELTSEEKHECWKDAEKDLKHIKKKNPNISFAQELKYLIEDYLCNIESYKRCKKILSEVSENGL